MSSARRALPQISSRPALALAYLLAAVFPLHALAATDTWSSATSGNFSTGPWSPSLPGPADTALFDQSGASTVTFTNSPTNTAFQVSAGNVTFNAGDSPESYTLTGSSQIGGNGTLTLGAAGSAFTLNAGDITVNNVAADLNINSLATLNIGNFNIGTIVSNISNAATVTNSGAVSLSAASTLTIGSAGDGSSLLNLAAGSFTTGTGLTTINTTGTLTMTGGALSVLGDITLSGGTLSQSAGAFSWANSHTLTLQSLSTASFAGAFITPTGALISLNGPGSQFNVTGPNANLHVTNGASISILAGTLESDQFLNIENGSITDNSGALSLFVNAPASGSQNVIGSGAGSTGSLTLENSSDGSAANGFQIAVANGAGSLNLLSGALLTSGSIDLADDASASTGSITITGGTLTQSTTSYLTVGRTAGGAASITLGPSGSLHTGIGLTTINPTGIVNISGGFFQSNGDILVNGGAIIESSGLLGLADGHTLTIQSGGNVSLAGLAFTSANSVININGPGSQFNETGAAANLVIAGSTAISVTNGGSLHSDLYFFFGGSNGSGSVTVDGAGSSITSNASADSGELSLGATSIGILTLLNSATGSLPGGLSIGSSAGSVGVLSIQSGASLTTGNITVGFNNVTLFASVNVTGGTLTQSGGASLLVGAGSLSNASVTIGPAGVYNTGTGSVSLAATGAFTVHSGGALNLNGPMSVGAGAVFTGSGALNSTANIDNFGTFVQSGPQSWAPNTTFTNNSGTATFLSDPGATTPNHLSLVVTGGTVTLVAFDKLAALYLNGGTTIFGPAADPPAPASSTTIFLRTNGIFEFASSYNFDSPLAPTLTGTGHITIDPGVSLTLPIDTAFSGTILVNGTLILAPALNPSAPTFNFTTITSSPVPEPASLAFLTLTPLLLTRRPKPRHPAPYNLPSRTAGPP
ncbi:MAG TPA: hypothetical protein VHQ47_10230 [Phycisphaerae bacterium]|nr:hypothetical protein [Phycisphaerae bacterium]